MIRLGIYEKAMPSNLSFKEKLSAAKEASFDFVELSIDETDEKLCRLEMSKESKQYLLSDMRSEGIAFESICLSAHRKYPLGSTNASIRNKSLEILEKAITFADELGIRLIQLAGYDVYYEPSTTRTKELFYEGLRRACEMAEKKNVILAIETMETEFIDTVKKALSIVKKINSPYLKIYPDVGNLTNASLLYDYDVLEDLMAGENFIEAVHLKDSKVGIYRDLEVGEGHVDFQRIVETTLKLNISRYVVEFWYKGEADWKQSLYKANSFIRQYLH